MHITREELIKKLAEKGNYYQRDVRNLFKALDSVMLDYFNQATLDEEITVQVIKGIKLGCKIVPERERLDPKTHLPILVSETVKPFVKFSDYLRETLQKQYGEKKDG